MSWDTGTVSGDWDSSGAAASVGNGWDFANTGAVSSGDQEFTSDNTDANADANTNGNANDNDNVEADSEANGNGNTLPEIRIVELKKDNAPNLTSFVLLNGERFGKPQQANLKGNDERTNPLHRIKFVCKEPNLTGAIIISWTAQRTRDHPKTEPQHKHNPYRENYQNTYVTIDPTTVRGFEYQTAKSYLETHGSLPEGYGLDNDKFEAEGKICVRFWAKEVICHGLQVHPLVSKQCEEIFRRLVVPLSEAEVGGVLDIFAIIRDTEDIIAILQMMHLKSAYDCHDPPEVKWIMNSPVTNILGVGNIYPMTLRPAFTDGGTVQRKKYCYYNMTELKVDLSYAAADEQSHQDVEAIRFKADSYNMTLTAIPKSRFKDNANDNSLPKSYLAVTSWEGKKQTRPKPGDKLEVDMPFPYGPCPEYAGDWVKPGTDAGDYLEGTEDETQDYKDFIEPTHEAIMAQKQIDEKQLAVDEIVRRNTRWTATVVKSNKTIPSGCIALILSRPVDARWKGPPGTALRVPTEVPSSNSKFLNDDRLRIEFQEAKKHSLKMWPTFSRQMFKDTIAGLRAFAELDVTDDFAFDDVQAHLTRYMLAYNDRLPFRPRKFFEEFAASNWEDFCADFSKVQRQNFILTFTLIAHGIVLAEGTVASGKSRLSEIATLSIIAKNNDKHVEVKQQVVMTQQTNAGCDETSLRMEGLCEKHGIKANIVRVGPLSGEKSRFIGSRIPGRRTPTIDLSNEDVEQFIAHETLNKFAKSYEESRGSSRQFSSETTNLHLFEAMAAYAKVAKDQKITDTMEQIAYLQENPESTVITTTTVKPGVQYLLTKTLEKWADVIIGTTAQIIHGFIYNAVPNPVAVFIDEVVTTPTYIVFAILGCYKPTGFFSLVGDTKQRLALLMSYMNKAHWAPLCEAAAYSPLERALIVVSTSICFMNSTACILTK